MEKTKTKKHIASIDFLRTFAIIMVIILHTFPYKNPFPDISGLTLYANVAINHFCRWAVPFFFIASGYFMGKKIRKGVPFSEFGCTYLKRLILVFFAWALIYNIIPRPNDTVENIFRLGAVDGITISFSDRIGQAVQSAKDNPLVFAFSPYYHLWFLTSLVTTVVIFFILIKIKKENWIFPISILLFLLALYWGSYSTLLGVSRVPFDFEMRNGPFFSTLFFSVGWIFSGWKRFPGTVFALGLIIFGYFLQIFEAAILFNHFHSGRLIYDFFIGTVPFGIGVFLLCMSVPDLGAGIAISKIGTLTLGIYVIHPFIMESLYFMRNYMGILAWQIISVILIFFLSLILVNWIKKSKAINFLVN